MLWKYLLLAPVPCPLDPLGHWMDLKPVPSQFPADTVALSTLTVDTQLKSAGGSTGSNLLLSDTLLYNHLDHVDTKIMRIPKRTLEKSQINATNAIMHPLRWWLV